MEWTMEKTLQLIEQVAMRQSIWNFTPKDYKNRIVIQKRKDALTEVANFFNTTPKQIEHKLGILRTQFSREKIKMIKSRKSAVSDEDVYESKWFAYKPMSFMMMQKRREHNNLDDGDNPNECIPVDDTISNDNSSFNEFKISHVESLANEEIRIKPDSDETREQTPKRKLEDRKYTNDNFVTEPNGSSAQRISKHFKQESINNFDKDEFIIFGESVSFQLRNLKTKYGKSLAKLNIQKAIFDAELWEEKNVHHINVSRQARSEIRSSEENDDFPDGM